MGHALWSGRSGKGWEKESGVGWEGLWVAEF
jgi:hypothetical protein